MTRVFTGRAASQVALAAATACLLAGCGSSGSSSTGGTIGNLLMFGATTPPPAAPEAPIEVFDCPPVTVVEGRAAMRSGEGASVRSQVAISELARECTGRADGTTVVKVGIQLRALLGPGSGAGRFDTPLSIVIKRGEQVLATRSRRVALAVPAGQSEATTVVVEDGLVVPPGTGEFDIEVAIGGAAAREAAPARARRRRG